ncbi:MAG: hypothetical protein QXV17_11980 [Candidatus Micrarchaeaceae archaeon]
MKKPQYYESNYINGDIDFLTNKTSGWKIIGVSVKATGNPAIEKIVLELDGAEKPFILSKANYPIMERTLGEDIDKWVGHKVYFERLATIIAGQKRTVANIFKVE